MHWGCVFAGVEPATFWFFRLGVSFRLESGKRWRNKIDKIHKCFLFPSGIMMDTKNIVRSLWEPITTFQILLLLEFWFYLRSWCLPNSSKCPDNLCLYSIYNGIVFCLGMLLDAAQGMLPAFSENPLLLLLLVTAVLIITILVSQRIWSDPKNKQKHHQDLMKTCQMWHPDVSSSCSKHNRL